MKSRVFNFIEKIVWLSLHIAIMETNRDSNQDEANLPRGFASSNFTRLQMSELLFILKNNVLLKVFTFDNTPMIHTTRADLLRATLNYIAYLEQVIKMKKIELKPKVEYNNHSVFLTKLLNAEEIQSMLDEENGLRTANSEVVNVHVNLSKIDRVVTKIMPPPLKLTNSEVVNAQVTMPESDCVASTSAIAPLELSRRKDFVRMRCGRNASIVASEANKTLVTNLYEKYGKVLKHKRKKRRQSMLKPLGKRDETKTKLESVPKRDETEGRRSKSVQKQDEKCALKLSEKCRETKIKAESLLRQRGKPPKVLKLWKNEQQFELIDLCQSNDSQSEDSNNQDSIVPVEEFTVIFFPQHFHVLFLNF